MQDPYQQLPDSRNSVGYRPLVPVDFSKSMGNSVTAYVAAAAGIGLLAGVGIALTSNHPRPAASPQVSEALNTQSSGLSPVPAVYAATTPSLLSEVGSKKKSSVSSPLLLQTGKQSARKPARAGKKNALHRFWNWKKNRSKRNATKRTTYVSPDLSVPAEAEVPLFAGIEGDVTVASYDVAMGTIGTYEGSTFILDKSGTATDAIPWDDYPFNVHYRCGGDGTCTLVHRGATASAKMTR